MSQLRRIVLVRHGETDGESSIRYHGSTDVELSATGRAQMRCAAAGIDAGGIDLVVASPLRRSWRSAAIVGSGAPVQLEADFREIHFGRWEGLTRDEIEAQDPIRFQDWQSGAEGFDYPGGEKRSEFRARVKSGLERLLAVRANSVLAVLHKGVIRVVVEELVGETLEADEPALGELIELTRKPDGSWYRGRQTSNPPGVEREIVIPA